MIMDVAHIVSAVSGKLIAAEGAAKRTVEGVTWDSRAVVPGCLYIALVGERVDGHAYAADAVRAGAAAVLATHALDSADEAAILEEGAAIIEVPDANEALDELASNWRAEGLTGSTVVGLTGSTGKTSTKNLVRDVLSRAFSVAATKANQNNELGVPRTLLDARPSDEFVVVEMGMRGTGQIASLCKIVRPDWGIVTNVGESHIELLGSRDNIARAKAELFEALPDERGVAFINVADDYAFKMWKYAKLEERGVTAVFFGGSDWANGDVEAIDDMGAPFVFPDYVSLDEEGRPSFVLHAENVPIMGSGLRASAPARVDGGIECKLELRGMHSVANACAAAAVGLVAGMTLEQVRDALALAQPEKGREQLLHMKCGALLVNDAYNANPDSMKASLATFAATKAAGRHIAVLGEMGELGDFAEECHDRVGACAGAYGFEKLVFVGEHARTMADAARRAGAPAGSIACLEGTGGLRDLLESEVLPDDAVLLKASHFMGFEKIAEGLVG